MLQIIQWTYTLAMLVFTEAWAFIGFIGLCVIVVYVRKENNKERAYKATKAKQIEQQQTEQENSAKEAYIRAYPFLCECNKRFIDYRRRASHRRSCVDYQNTLKTHNKDIDDTMGVGAV